MDLEKHRRMYFDNIYINSPSQYVYNTQSCEYEMRTWNKEIYADYIIEETWEDGSKHRIFLIHVIARYNLNGESITFDTPETTLSDDAVDIICELIKREITNIG